MIWTSVNLSLKYSPKVIQVDLRLKYAVISWPEYGNVIVAYLVNAIAHGEVRGASYGYGCGSRLHGLELLLHSDIVSSFLRLV